MLWLIQLDADEPEALKKMRLEREEREKREQEAKDAAAAADAKLRAETGKFVSGQDLREARMSDAYELEQKKLGSAGAETGPDIRQKVRAMQGAARRMRADKERLQHQSMKSGKTLAEVAEALMALLNDKMPEALGEIVMRWSEVISAAATKANAFMNGSFRVPRAQVLSMLLSMTVGGHTHTHTHTHTICIYTRTSRARAHTHTHTHTSRRR